CESVSVRSAETQPLLPEACFAREAADAARPEPLFPPAERILWNAEYRGSHLAGPRPAPHDVWEREVGHHRAGCADFITVIEMVDAGFVEIDSLLDPAQPECPGPECVVFGSILGHRRDVMQPFDLIEHDAISASRLEAPLSRRDMAPCRLMRNVEEMHQTVAISRTLAAMAEAQAIERADGGPIFESDEAAVAVALQPVDPRCPVHRAAARLAATLGVGKVHVRDTIHAPVQHVLGMLAHHRRMVDVIEEPDLR